MTITLTETQNSLLRAAFDRNDRCVVASNDVKGAAFKKVVQKLMTLGLVRECRARADMRAWRRDDEGRAYAVRLSAAGVRTIPRPAEEGGEAMDAPPHVRPSGPAGPRTGSKLANVIGLLERKEGASLVELMEGTGWLAHTTRAAMTGLRKRCYAVSLDRSNRVRGSVYRILKTSDASTHENA